MLLKDTMPWVCMQGENLPATHAGQRVPDMGTSYTEKS